MLLTIVVRRDILTNKRVLVNFMDKDRIKECRSRNLALAKKNKNDEFYTRIEDIKRELVYYKSCFRDKIVYLNCDDIQVSQFWTYFVDNFDELGLKCLIASGLCDDHYHEYDQVFGLRSYPFFDGDFRSEQAVELLKYCDIVVTNPPFSLFREYIDLLVKYQKQFLIISNLNSAVYENVFPLLRDGQMHIGYTKPSAFYDPMCNLRRFGNTLWYTNLLDGIGQTLSLTKTYDSAVYHKFDNYDAININKVRDIPYDYDGVMGVPISYLYKHDPDQFMILGITSPIQSDIGVYPTKFYENVTFVSGDIKKHSNRVNTRPALLFQDEPDCGYYLADNADGYLVNTYVRILIQKKGQPV